MKNLAQHYERMKIIRPSYIDYEYLGVDDMLKATVNLNSRDKTPVSNMAAMVLWAILQDARYPVSLYTDTFDSNTGRTGKSNMGKSSNHKSIYDKKLQEYGGGTVHGTE